MQVYSFITFFRGLAPFIQALPCFCCFSLFAYGCSQPEKVALAQSTNSFDLGFQVESHEPVSSDIASPDPIVDSRSNSVYPSDYKSSLQSSFDQFELVFTRDDQSASLSIHALLNHLAQNEKICLPAFGQRNGEQLDVVSEIVYDQTNLQKIVLDDSGCFNVHMARVASFNYKLTAAASQKNKVWIAQTLSSVVKPDFAAFPAESVFLERSESVDKPVRVAVLNSNDNINVYTTLKIDADFSNQYNYYHADDYFNLNRSYFVFGNLSVASDSSVKPRISVYTDNVFSLYTSVLVKEFRAIFDYYAKNLPKHTPEYINIFIFSGDHDAYQSDGFARPNGIVLQFGNEGIKQPTERRMLIAHELFHLYNGENLHYDKSNYQKISWFLEGTTQFVALHTLVALNYVSQTQVNDILSGFVNQVLTNNNSTKREFHPYVDGFFLTWLIQLIWTQSPSVHSNAIFQFWTYLDDISDWSQQYTQNWLKQNLENYSGYAFDDFFRHYIDELEPVPYRSILNDYGLCLHQFDLQKYDLRLSYRFDSTLAQYVVTYVEPKSVAASAGLKKGDKFVPLKSFNWRIPEDKYIYKDLGNGSGLNLKLPVEPVIVTQYEVVKCK